eukprot:GEMP01020737.1.p1 GENE.GEMP01020737.1~~GEMP01020737.1.p1  ORF type:complete len:409 (+),score=89.31 GEMP01020737.1:64-1290(+)
MLRQCGKRLSRNAYAVAPWVIGGFRGMSSQVNLFSPTPEHAQFREMMRTFTANEVEPQALENNRNERLNLPLLKKLGELGLHGICVDDKYGGANMDPVATVIAHEELSYSDPAFCLAYLAHSLLFVHNLSVNGSEAQKLRYLPSTVSGEKIGGMCMSEPAVGTDVLGMKMKAEKKGDKWILNGSKMWITNGCLDDKTLGDVFLVYARTGEGRQDISLFIVKNGYPGFKLGQKIADKCGMRASTTAELVFENCEVPADDLVGEVNGGMQPMMRNLEIERLALAAMSLGIARRCVHDMVNYANERQSFGKPLRSFGQIQRHIAESFSEYQAGRAYAYNLAGNVDLHAEEGLSRVDSDGIRICRRVCRRAVVERREITRNWWRNAGGAPEKHHERPGQIRIEPPAASLISF